MINLYGFINSLVFSLPASKRLTVNWNYGRILGIILIFQIFTGSFLAFYFSSDSINAFTSVQYIIYEVNFGWIFRIIHFNGASLFFLFVYLHIFKGLYLASYRLKEVWISGLTIYLLLIIEAFMGYVLVWAQISFWASVVITSLLRVIPVWGPVVVTWVWGGFTVRGATLKFFFVLHFLLPWGLLFIILIHILLLHNTGSSSSLYCHGDYDKVCFFPEYWGKDSYNLNFWLIFLFFSLIFSYKLGDPEMFIEADPIIRPVHIVPEWYFLFAYAILRAIPNKILGVIALLISIISFYFFSLFKNYVSIMGVFNKLLISLFIFISIVLRWLGQCLVEDPFIFFSGFMSFSYFFIIYFLLFFYWLISFIFYCVFSIIKIY